jgi:hypothetical protein
MNQWQPMTDEDWEWVNYGTLAMAKDMVQQEYSSKFAGWELTAKRDEKTGQLVSTVTMPEFPGLDKILETAEKMYGFVNQSTNTKK